MAIIEKHILSHLPKTVVDYLIVPLKHENFQQKLGIMNHNKIYYPYPLSRFWLQTNFGA